MTDDLLDEKHERQRRDDHLVLNATLVGVMFIGVGFGILASILLGGIKPKDVKITADNVLVTVDRIEDRVTAAQLKIADLQGKLETRSADAEVQIARLEAQIARLELELARLRDTLQGQKKDGTATTKDNPNP